MRYRLACALVVLALTAPLSAQFENVGTISFPTSGSPQAQPHFLRGVAILHSFGWKQAIAEFKLAQKAQPDFAMAYWGETLCYNHPLMAEQDGKNPREVLKRLGPDTAARLAKAPTPREKGFLQAVEELWGEGEWRKRRVAYMNAMERLYKQFPADDEVKTFYALSLLSGARALDDNTFRYEVKAGALALDVFHRNPKHPGAPHYTIHSFDDPVHAPLSLDAAKAYAAIVPAVSHGVHMPTHIFIQHGMWNEVSSQNMRAFQVAKDLWQPGDVPGDMVHSLDWGQYGFLQLGDYAGARKAIELFDQMVETTKHQRARGAAALVEGPLHHRDRGVEGAAGRGGRLQRDAAGQWAERGEDRRPGHGGEDGGAAGRQGAGRAGRSRGLAARTRSTARRRLRRRPGGDGKAVRVMHRELSGLIAYAKGQKDQAVTLLKEAVQIEESMRPPNGAADPVKPAHELLGEVLLQVGKPADAAAAFDTCLVRMPNRARSLHGSATAHAAAGHKDLAAERRATLASFWKGKAFANSGTQDR